MERRARRRGARAGFGHPLDLWHEVPLVAQCTGMSCWAAAASMLVGWRERLPVDGPEVASGLGKWRAFREGLKPKDTQDLCARWGLVPVSGHDHSVDAISGLLARYGPLWLGEAVPGLHVVVVTGMRGDGTPEGTTVHINDPWPIARGERYSLPFAELMHNYRAAARMAGLHAQLLHSGGRSGSARVPGRFNHSDAGVLGRLPQPQMRLAGRPIDRPRGRDGGLDMTLERMHAYDEGLHPSLQEALLRRDDFAESFAKPKTKDFELREFDCKDGTPVPQKYYPNVKRLMKNLQVLRDNVGKKVYVRSGYRTPSHNTKIGGATRSQHLVAKAGDIQVQGMTARQVFARILKLIAAGKMEQGGMGLYRTFVHYDVRGSKARWMGKGVTTYPKAQSLDLRAELKQRINDELIVFDAPATKQERLRDELLGDNAGTKVTQRLQSLVIALADLEPIRISSLLREDDEGSRHATGQAVDIGNEGIASKLLPKVTTAQAIDVLDIDEIIFDARKADGSHEANLWNHRRGERFNYSEGVLRGHRDHIHFSVTG